MQISRPLPGFRLEGWRSQYLNGVRLRWPTYVHSAVAVLSRQFLSADPETVSFGTHLCTVDRLMERWRLEVDRRKVDVSRASLGEGEVRACLPEALMCLGISTAFSGNKGSVLSRQSTLLFPIFAFTSPLLRARSCSPRSIHYHRSAPARRRCFCDSTIHYPEGLHTRISNDWACNVRQRPEVSNVFETVRVLVLYC